jgi:hypothetical protein
MASGTVAIAALATSTTSNTGLATANASSTIILTSAVTATPALLFKTGLIFKAEALYTITYKNLDTTSPTVLAAAAVGTAFTSGTTLPSEANTICKQLAFYSFGVQAVALQVSPSNAAWILSQSAQGIATCTTAPTAALSTTAWTTMVAATTVPYATTVDVAANPTYIASPAATNCAYQWAIGGTVGATAASTNAMNVATFSVASNNGVMTAASAFVAAALSAFLF